MQSVKTKPFQVTRIPSLTGEWLDIHLSESGKICIDSSGYVEVDSKILTDAISAVMKSETLE